MILKHTYTLDKDKKVAVTKEVVPIPVGDPLYETTKQVAEANPGFIACGTQASKDGVPGEIMTTHIPK